METHSGATTDRRIMSDLLTAYKTHTVTLCETGGTGRFRRYVPHKTHTAAL